MKYQRGPATVNGSVVKSTVQLAWEGNDVSCHKPGDLPCFVTPQNLRG